jgi:hypothetical protein
MTTSAEVIAQLEARVAQRRQEGKYPIGLEQQLEAEFKAIMAVVHRGDNVLDDVKHLVEQCERQVKLLNAPISHKSRIPGFGLVHRLIGLIVGRQTSEIAARVQSTLDLQQQVITLLMKQLEIQQGTDVRVLNQLSHAMQDRLMMIDVLAESIVELERKVAKGS